jgi:hypothetical protein
MVQTDGQSEVSGLLFNGESDKHGPEPHFSVSRASRARAHVRPRAFSLWNPRICKTLFFFANISCNSFFSDFSFEGNATMTFSMLLYVFPRTLGFSRTCSATCAGVISQKSHENSIFTSDFFMYRYFFVLDYFSMGNPINTVLHMNPFIKVHDSWQKIEIKKVVIQKHWKTVQFRHFFGYLGKRTRESTCARASGSSTTTVSWKWCSNFMIW